jgi:uncharacterized protein
MGTVPDFEKARQYCLTKLENELSSKLTYHNLNHTVKEVIPAAEYLSTLELVGDEDRLLLLTAGYFHDLGFTHQRQGHEAISIQLAEVTLPGFDYSEIQMDVIRGIIQATCIPQSPTSLLERIMADADLSYLGQDIFWERSSDLRNELENYDSRYTDEDWNRYQLRFIQTHQYFTASARSLWEDAEQQHLVEIRKRLSQTIQAKENQ